MDFTEEREKERLLGHITWLWPQKREHLNPEISFSFSEVDRGRNMEA